MYYPNIIAEYYLNNIHFPPGENILLLDKGTNNLIAQFRGLILYEKTKFLLVNGKSSNNNIAKYLTVDRVHLSEQPVSLNYETIIVFNTDNVGSVLTDTPQDINISNVIQVKDLIANKISLKIDNCCNSISINSLSGTFNCIAAFKIEDSSMDIESFQICND